MLAAFDFRILASVDATLNALAFLLICAGLLLLPYLAWSLFATALTLRIWQLNPRS